MLTKVSEFLKSNWFFVGLSAVIFLGTKFPWLGEAFKPWITYLISFSLILIGFRFETSELRFSKRQVGAVVLTCFCSFAFMPLLSYGLGHWLFSADREMFVGIVLAGSVPTTQASSVIWTDLSGGNHSLALILMTVINIIGVFLSPWLLHLGLGSTVSVPVWDMLRTLVLFVLAPVFVGVFIRRWIGSLPAFVKSGSRILNLVLIWITVMTALSSGRLSEVPLALVLFAVALQYVLTALLSYQGARFLGLAKEDALAVMFCSAQVTITFAAIVGFTYFTPRSIIYVVVYHLFQQFMGQLTAKLVKAKMHCSADAG